MPRTALLAFAALAASATALSGCVPLVLGAGAAAGYVGLQDRPFAQVAEDTQVKLLIKDKLTHANFAYLTDVGIDVYYGDVLLTGIVPTQAEGEKILAAVRQTAGVKKVYNELFVGAAYTTGQKAKDAWISTQIQPRLIGTKDAYPLNYLITVVNNHVYIMGTTNSVAEKEHVLHVLRTTSGVRQVHDYLVLKNDDKDGDGRTNTVVKPGSASSDIRNPNPFEEDLLAH